MNADIIRALIAKDLTLFFRNRFFALITVLGLVAYIAIYFLMPNTVDEMLEIGFYAPNLPAVVVEELEGDAIVVRQMESEEALIAAMTAGDFNTGIVLPPDWAQRLAAGERDQVTIYFTADFPNDLKSTYAMIAEEMAFLVSGQTLDIESDEIFLGVDRAGEQTPLRERMLPLLAVFILMMETLGLASLLSAEIEGGTLQALLITPLRAEGLFVAKGVTGVGLAFVQVVLLMGVTGGLSRQPLIVLVALLLGSVLVTGIGFLIATVARDMMSVLGWGMLAIILLVIPALGVLIPGIVSEWVRVMPSYYLVDIVYQAANFDIGWSDVARPLLLLSAFAAAFLVLGVIALRRKFQ